MVLMDKWIRFFVSKSKGSVFKGQVRNPERPRAAEALAEAQVEGSLDFVTCSL